MEEEELLRALIFIVLMLISQLSSIASELDGNEQFFSQIIKQNKLGGLFKTEPQTNLYAFASFSMADIALRQLVTEARKYQAVIVFRGLIDNSFVKTQQAIANMVDEGEQAAIIIDPILFREFNIKFVPTYVLQETNDCQENASCLVKQDRLEGNVSLKYVLEKFAQEGDLNEIAGSILAVQSKSNEQEGSR